MNNLHPLFQQALAPFDIARATTIPGMKWPEFKGEPAMPITVADDNDATADGPVAVNYHGGFATVREVNQYGTIVFKPVNVIAHLLCNIARQGTMTQNTINMAKELGYVVRVEGAGRVL